MLFAKATFVATALANLLLVTAVKHHDFKTCSQSGFCKRGRAIAERAKEHKNWKSPYSIDANTVEVGGDKSAFSAVVRSSLYPDIKFRLDLSILEDGVIRAQMDEVEGIRQRYNEAAGWSLIAAPKPSKSIEWTKGSKDIRATYGEKGEVEARITYSPLRIALLRNGKEEVVINGDGLLHMEHHRNKPAEPEKKDEPELDTKKEEEPQTVIKAPGRSQAWFEGEEEIDYWDEQFSSWKDTKPKGRLTRVNVYSQMMIPCQVLRASILT
jgi:mannosyl-oligosaccharide alpha-1,3-glucosidase